MIANNIEGLDISLENAERFLAKSKKRKLTNHKLRVDSVSFYDEITVATEEFAREYGEEFYRNAIKG